MGSPDLNRVEQFLYDEADCLDRADLDAWLDLYTEDGTYWMPVQYDQEDPFNHISLFYDDDRALMEVRKRNFVHPGAASKEYPVRASHIIGNVRVVEHEQESGALTVRSNFQCVLYYREKKTLYAGKYTHQLVADGDSYLIQQKRVDLIDCDGVHNTIIIYL